MALHIASTSEELLVGPSAVRLIRDAVRAGGRVLVLCPSLSLSLELQRALARNPELALGVECATPETWLRLRWALYGDGRALVTPPQRVVMMARLLSAEPEVAPLDRGSGTAGVLCQLAQRALPWLPPESERPGLTQGERRAVELVEAYGGELVRRGLVEPCEALALLPGSMANQHASLPACLLLGFGEMPRATREFAVALGKVTSVDVLARDDGGPASAEVRRMVAELAETASGRGIEVACDSVPAADDAGEEGTMAGGDAAGLADGPGTRAPELQRLLDRLFRVREGKGILSTGAVRLLEPAGPLAVDEAVCRYVVERTSEGASRVVLVVPDVRRAWKGIAPKLRARGISVRAQLGCIAAKTRVGAGFLRLAGEVARLVELDASSPKDPAEPLPDMSWWPPRDISDFLLANVGGMSVERVWGRDANWRGNRILTPAAVLKTLTNPSATSPALAACVRELMSGHIAAAATRLSAGLEERASSEKANGAPTDASGRASNGPSGSAAPAGADVSTQDVPTQPAPTEEVLSALEDAAALQAICAAGRALKDAGVALGKDGVSLTELVDLAAMSLDRVRASWRVELTAPEADCEVLIVSSKATAALPPMSADVLVYLGLDAASSSISVADGALDELLAHTGVDVAADGLQLARAAFAAAVRVPRSELALVRPARDERASETFPAVMLSEVLACYATEEVDGDEVPLLRPDAASKRDEGLVEENLSATGARTPLRRVPGAAAAGRLNEALRRLVVVPRDGQAELPEGRPSLSASQIESYLECPYKWFTLRRLGLDDCDAGFSNMEMGTFAHRVLEVTHRDLFLAASRKAGLVAEDVAERPERSLFWFDPSVRVPGSRVDEDTLAKATDMLVAEFDEHLEHQRLEGNVRSKQALIPHGQAEQRKLDELKRDLVDTLAYESTRFKGFEPRLFEGRFGGISGLAATYAGADLVGTIDRIDVNERGQALVIDYKHKSSLFEEYALSPRGEQDFAAGFRLPRRVQTLVYASVARNLLRGSGVEVVGAVYLGTRGNHQIAGAVSARDIDAVWAARDLRASEVERVSLPVPGARTFDELLDRTEEKIAEAIDDMRAGVIDARPIAKDACNWCPVLDCERRLS